MNDNVKCAICFLTVAPADPERQTVHKKVVHGNCLKRYVASKRQQDIKQEQVRQEGELVLWIGAKPIPKHVN